MLTLGISCYNHDSAVALYDTKRGIVFAAEEERFSRKKNDAGFPVGAIRHALKQETIPPESIERVIFYEDPEKKLLRVMRSIDRNSDSPQVRCITAQMATYVQSKLPLKLHLSEALDDAIGVRLPTSRIFIADHHESHVLSAIASCPFVETDILCVDAVGELETVSYWNYSKNRLKKIGSIEYPHSIGLFYSTITAFLGFRVNNGEYKVMGLAAYGEPIFSDILKSNLIEWNSSDGSITLNPKYFTFELGEQMFSEHLVDLLGFPPRQNSEPIQQHHKDLAASVQLAAEEAIFSCCQFLHQQTGGNHLLLTGGVAQNCLANSKIPYHTSYKRYWSAPVSGDAGCALGAALSKSCFANTEFPPSARIQNLFLGRNITDEEARHELANFSLKYHWFDQPEFTECLADSISNGSVVGWAIGRAEYGPRALGNRSILADPRNPDIRQRLNLITKNRESFRPFAPVILDTAFSDWFSGQPNPYMTTLVDFAPTFQKYSNPSSATGCTEDSALPAVVHKDGTSRVQVLSESDNPRLYRLIEAFAVKTGVPMLLNTSFNRNEEPIVNSASDAISCFLATDIDILCLAEYIVFKNEQRSLHY